MEKGRWSWIKRLRSGEVIQVDADSLAVCAPGALTFLSKYKDGDYTTLVLPAEVCERCSIMSQLSGGENGFDVLQRPKD